MPYFNLGSLDLDTSFGSSLTIDSEYIEALEIGDEIEFELTVRDYAQSSSSKKGLDFKCGSDSEGSYACSFVPELREEDIEEQLKKRRRLYGSIDHYLETETQCERPSDIFLSVDAIHLRTKINYKTLCIGRVTEKIISSTDNPKR